MFEAVAARVVNVVDGGKRLVLHAAAGGEKEGEEEGAEGFHGFTLYSGNKFEMNLFSVFV